MSIFKRAHARGIAEGLQQNGVVSFPNEQTMKTAAHQAAQKYQNDPIEGNYTEQEMAKVAEHIINCHKELQSRGKTAANPQAVSIGTEGKAVGDMIQKLAKETNAPGSQSANITGDKPGQDNTLENASKHSPEAKMDQEKRPTMYAVEGEGSANMDESQNARVGEEQPHPRQEGGTKNPGTTNSVEQASKAPKSAAAVLNELVGKTAESNQPGTPSANVDEDRPEQDNTLDNSTKHSPESKMDEKKRPEEYAVVGEGNANFSEPAEARTGTEQPHPRQEGGIKNPETTNSVEQASKTSAWNKLAKQLAREVVPQLPENMPEQQKQAVVRQCMAEGPQRQEEVIKQASQRFHANEQRVDSVLQGLV